MESIFEFMSKDHDRLDSLIEEFKSVEKGDKARFLFHDFKTGLQRHIIWEEEILFPLFENKTVMHNTGPTSVKRSEHRQIKELLEKIYTMILKGEKSGIYELGENLIGTLTTHNEKEEHVLYPLIDKALDKNKRESILTQMDNLPSERYDTCCL